MSIYQEFINMLNNENNPDIIDAIWRNDFDKLRELRKNIK